MTEPTNKNNTELEDVYYEMLQEFSAPQDRSTSAIIEESNLSPNQILGAIPAVLNALAHMVVSEPTVKQKLLNAVKAGTGAPAPAVGSGQAPPAAPPQVTPPNNFTQA